jgi:hypothetical protein
MVLCITSRAENGHAGADEMELTKALEELGRCPEDPPQLQRAIPRPGEKALLWGRWRPLAPVFVRAFGGAPDGFAAHFVNGV